MKCSACGTETGDLYWIRVAWICRQCIEADDKAKQREDESAEMAATA